MKFSPLSLLFAALVLPALPLSAQVLPELNYQGRVAVNGTAFTGTGQFRFALVADNGSVVWSSHATNTTGIAVQNGLYSVRLGDTSLTNMASIPSALFIEPGLRLRVWFNDGVNGLQQLAPDQFVTPVGYAHRASSAASADSIPASAIDGGSIQPSRLAHTLQTGTAASIESFPATGGVLNGTFPQPFETPPVVTMDGITLPAANVTTTGFTLTIPPRDILVDDGTPASGNTGEVREAMLVGGFPAIAYIDPVSGDVNFVRATNAQGSAWSAPVVAAVVPVTHAARHLSFAIVGGNPAIAYWTDSTSTVAWSVNYVRATNANGTAWGAPVTAVGTNNRTVDRCVLKTAEVSPGVTRPFIAYNLNDNTGSARVHVIKGNDAAGTTWGGQQTPDPALNGGTEMPHFDLQDTTGGLLIIYSDPANALLKAVSSTSLAANTWGTPRLAGIILRPQDIDIYPTGGGLSVCWREDERVFSSEVPDSPALVTPSLVCQSGQVSAMVPGDRPEILTVRDGVLSSIPAADDIGIVWQAARPVQAQPGTSTARPAGVRLADGTVLAVFHSSVNGGQVRVSGTQTPFTGQWQAALSAPVVASAVADGSITRPSLAPDFFGNRLRTDGTFSFATGDRAAALGSASWASGQNTFASGDYSLAAGLGSTASGNAATALGESTTASGFVSTALGYLSTASGLTSTAMGYDTTASGQSSTAMGQNAVASGSFSMAMGNGPTASGGASMAIGYVARAEGYASMSLGYLTRAETFSEISLGTRPVANTGSEQSFVATDVLLEVGNGTSGAPSNALTIFKNGLTGLGPADTLAEVTHLLTLPNSATPGIGQGRANAWTTYSDSRIKTEQRPIAYGLADIMRLQPRAYTQHSGCVENGTFKCEDATGGSAQTIGFIAQEVEKVIPEAVQKPADPANQLYGMDYEKLIPVLVKATQELKTENDTLKAQLTAMQQRLEKLERSQGRRK